jgi:hypothetical protein
LKKTNPKTDPNFFESLTNAFEGSFPKKGKLPTNGRPLGPFGNLFLAEYSE